MVDQAEVSMNYVKFSCPLCAQSLEAPAEMAGQSIDCPACLKLIEISVPKVATSQTIRIVPKKPMGNIYAAPLPDSDEEISAPDQKTDKSTMRKYEFTGDTCEYLGKILHRIVRLRDGQMGGWIETEINLSHEGDCWIYDEAKVYGNARIYGEAQVSSNASVADDAQVFGDARVTGRAAVSGDAKIYENAVVSGDTYVSGKAKIFGSARVSGYCTSVGGLTELSGNASISKNSVGGLFEQKTAEDFKRKLAINVLGILTFSSARWLKDRHDERKR